MLLFDLCQCILPCTPELGNDLLGLVNLTLGILVLHSNGDNTLFVVVVKMLLSPALVQGVRSLTK